MISEQEVRTRAGWIGVEISKSRARKASNPEFGLYRVRGSRRIERAVAVLGPDMLSRELTEWTAYAFTLEAIGQAVAEAIGCGSPAGPAALRVSGVHPDRRAGGRASGPTWWTVPTRWTSAYRGRRDFGVMVPTEGCTHAVMEACPAGASMGEHAHDASGCDMKGRPHLGPCQPPSIGDGVLRETAKQRDRAYKAEFHAEHMERREYGLRARHATKLRHNEERRRQEGPGSGPHLAADGSEPPSG